MKKIVCLLGLVLLSSFTFNASWYGEFSDGNYTYSGEKFDKNGMTCASNYFPMGTIIEVTNVSNKKSVVVRVNDRGGMGRYTIDLSKGAFSKIANLKTGIIEVKVKKLK
jgi:rare lipoprotein A